MQTMQTEYHFIGARVPRTEAERLEQLARAAGVSKSEVLRRLLRAAEVREVRRVEITLNTERLEEEAA